MYYVWSHCPINPVFIILNSLFMILYIDTTDFNSVVFAVGEGKEIIKKVYTVDPHKSHETLGVLDKFLKSHKIKKDDITKIFVNKGPGSYTGVRVGVTLAQALGFAWQVPVKAVAKDKFKV